MITWKKIYFDLDNTLYSHEYAFEKAIQDCYQDVIEEWKDKGINVPYVPLEDWFDVFKYFSDLYWDTYEQKKWTQTEYRRKRYLSTMQHFGLPCSEEGADRFHKKYYKQANQYVQPFPGLYTLLQFLIENKVEVGVITNGKKSVQIAKYEKLKLYRYIQLENFLISEAVGIEKPDPRIFKLALGTIDPKDALFIGDAWEHDVIGALDSGWQALYLNTQGRPRTSFHQPLEELTHFTQVLPFLMKFNKSDKESLN